MIGEYKLNEIYNEDSYKAIKKIPDKSVDCIYTDIPYELQSNGKGGGAFGDCIHKLIRRNMKDIIEGIDYSILDDFERISKKLNLFIWCNKQQILTIMNRFKDYSCEILVWAKENPTPFTYNVWLSDLEYCLYFRESGVKLNDGYEYKSKWYLSPTNKSDKNLYAHPTIKPYELVKRHLLHTTQKNDIVADFFLGSGTTVVAAKELNRRYIGFEIDPKYFQIAKDRLNGISAVERKIIDEGQLALF